MAPLRSQAARAALPVITISLVAALASSLTVSAISSSQDGGQSAFRSGVDLVALNVTLTDQRHRLVGGIDEEDFVVHEDGVPQDISFFSAGRLPLDLAVLLDVSSSMGPILGTAQQAAIGLVESLGPDDRVSVVEISDRPGTPISGGSTAAAVDTLRRTTAHGATALYDALYLALTDMVRARRTSTAIRRQAIAVLSDGQDTSSVVQLDHVMELVKASGVTIYTVMVTNAPDSWAADRNPDLQPLFIMRSLASETGGKAFVARQARELPDIYSGIGTELAAQYTLGYVSKNADRDGGFRRIVVTVRNRPEITARTRAGYQVPGQRSHH